MAIIGDGAGASLGLWQAGSFPGLELNAKMGTPVWFEAMTTGLDAALPLYRDVLDWEVSFMPSEPKNPIRYATHGGQNGATAGICDASSFLPEGTPSYWRLYILVENTDAALEKLQKLGGSVLDGPMDSPFGRLATVSDNAGATPDH